MQYTAETTPPTTTTIPLETLIEALATIPDPRRAQGRRYPLSALLALVVVGMLTHHTSVLGIAEWLTYQSTAFRRALGFPAGLPHQTTIQRLLARVDPAAVMAAIARVHDPHVPGMVRPRGSQAVAMDGKAQRGRLRHGATPTHPIHAITAWCHDLGGMLTHLVVDAQQHAAEWPRAADAIPQIDWQGRVLTGDALYCQSALCAAVVAAGGDYLLLVKQNQPTLYEDIAQVFRPLTTEETALTGVQTIQPLPITTARQIDKGHGRQEERVVQVSSDLAGYSTWPYLAQVFAVTRTWTVKGVTHQTVGYGITSLPAAVASAERILALKRGHWGIENTLHWSKDMILSEDACQTHVGHAADVLAGLRTTVISLLRRAGHRALTAQMRRLSCHPTEALAYLGIPWTENA